MSTASRTTSAPSRPPRSSGSDGALPAGAAGAAACANCATPLDGPYCSACGQRAAPPNPTLRELAEEAWGAFVSVDGKLVNSARLLVLRPGEMTARYLAGHRAPFIPPLRLYLTCSVAFFVLEASLPGESRTLQIHTTSTGAPRTPQEIERTVASMRAPAWKRRLKRGALRSAYAQQTSFAAQMLEHAPHAMFALVPLQAALLAVAYRRRRRNFPSHLVFSLHTHAAIFALLAISGALVAVLPLSVRTFVGVAVWVAILIHVPRSMRRVYGGRWSATLARGAFVGGVYVVGLLAALSALALATLWAIGAP